MHFYTELTIIILIVIMYFFSDLQAHSHEKCTLILLHTETYVWGIQFR